jgi:hypothetical protein
MRLRALLPVFVAVLVSFVGAGVAQADDSYHTDQLPFLLTDAGETAGHPELRSGHVVNIHANGPQVFAIEQYFVNGAMPNTTYQVALTLRVGGCEEPVAFADVPSSMVSTNVAGNGHAYFIISVEFADAFGLRNVLLGVHWTLYDENGVAAYQTECTEAFLD